ncbi:MAG TPA: recombinase family protein, partial [Candidatus Competibacteraceae bacterium]|nr:recombinase family protein [Candidatus Competibacteraceae bacterium]
TTTAGGRLIFTIFSAIAEFERKIIHERTRAALKWKRAQNQRVGQVRYGYRLAEDGVHEEADEREQALIAAALALRAEGTSRRRIGQHLKAQGHATRTGRDWHPEQIKLRLAAA